ncbi:hypothetical protein AMELA_G00074130 [Ameiurus melas]|uniref:Uncharacterized protein n=1 Tax=Ameiurus melas TaxID=219545 RepID=A0A7J6AYG4_AMEME|nr:hypothetical protein AMELA_G00074130 [Ameiurus melas]
MKGQSNNFRERFKTGGGLPGRPETDDLGDLLTVLINTQQPLESILDDDHLDSSDGAPVQSSFRRQNSFMYHSHTSELGWPETVCRSGGNMVTIHEKLDMELHVRK